ncbi:hypothetical protein [Opitutus sp. ER46]|uniref:hypothetical protein n=1 Tax=Opitutus sp. ER46 TaxID=2161864 RepID=UPI000D31DE8E|nr:hypothetical protein [Opitutus sp. ER46]PTX97786.1 hypothetical protein DB354_05780 [Opitutus sp. ER46]
MRLVPSCVAVLAILLAPLALIAAPDTPPAAPAPARIDRQALVTRHNPHVTTVDPWASLSVGNGQFAFTADVTGLQTFTAYYLEHGITTESEARWLWHENPNPQGYKLSDANRLFTAYGRTLGYPTKSSGPASEWLRQNPHILPLPQLALDLAREGGAPLAPTELSNIDQTLDLWTGTVTSRYTLAGAPVVVKVACDPQRDALAVCIESPLVASGRLGVKLAIPRGYDLRTKNNPPLDWSAPESHVTRVLVHTSRRLALEHVRDTTRYTIALATTADATFEPAGAHSFRIGATGAETRLEFTIGYAPGEPLALPAPAEVFTASAAHWPSFWRSGGAIDFTGSTDPRAAELERRLVLSQYLTAIQFAGDFPPQETGLTINTWYGKHHTEMIWWHAAHFALWGRDSFLVRNLDWYVRSLPVARAVAKERGLRGARWPKMIGPDGRESPGGNPLIVWNQPHPIHLAELLYRNNPSPALLARYRELVQESADAMASMLHWDASRRCYQLGPPLWIAQEIYDQATSMNPTYELSYWSWGLQTAQKWRERLGQPRNAEWDRMIKHLAPLPQKDGKYVAIESTPDTWDNKDSRHDHPSFLMALGQLPGDGVDRATMARTLDAVLAHWDWETKIWGWDYPMIAMTAARLGEPQKAVDVLLKSDSPNNLYTPNGHCRQRGDLPVYLPGNGALLAAAAMMAAGWDGAPTQDAPGFPRDGTWVVRHEGLRPLP